ncbi:hypothetical protein L0Y49_04200 [bacterium]|nr:hypothetical protein [bacterium]MCI0565624.1 hypothetical protein [bacterium]MCI0680380.1 hypothetical protein [bacterium]
MIYYVCTGGCGGVSDVPKNCESETCAHYHMPLEPREGTLPLSDARGNGEIPKMGE